VEDDELYEVTIAAAVIAEITHPPPRQRNVIGWNKFSHFVLVTGYSLGGHCYAARATRYALRRISNFSFISHVIAALVAFSLTVSNAIYRVRARTWSNACERRGRCKYLALLDVRTSRKARCLRPFLAFARYRPRPRANAVERSIALERVRTRQWERYFSYPRESEGICFTGVGLSVCLSVCDHDN